MVLRLLEINVISAQDLARVSRNMHTYAIVWVHSDRKLTTRIDNSGQTSPTWNDKFVFRIDDRFLEAETSAIMIEIYSQAWFKDVCVGTVCVLLNNILPGTSSNNSNMRFIALQVRRPSGRPQGILNMGVALLDNTMRSMPLYSEISFSNAGNKDNDQNSKVLRRCFSDRSRTTTDIQPKSMPFYNGSSIITGSIYHGSMVNGSMVNGSMVNGSELGGPTKGGASMCSDVGPSASVVAAAIAKGLYPHPANNAVPRNNINNGNNGNIRRVSPITHDDEGSCILNDWTEKDSGEGLRTKIERWRTELPPVHDTKYRRMTPSRHGERRKARPRRGNNGGGLFSCFGNAYGCEFSITCGGTTAKKRFGSSKAHLSPSQIESYSHSYM